MKRATRRTAAVVLATVALALVAVGPAAAQTFEKLAEHDGLSGPKSPLMLGQDGALYGMAEKGGTWGQGAVYRLVQVSGSAAARIEAVHAFTASQGNASPFELEQDGAGNLYGVTQNGGANGQGTVFKLSWDGTSWAYSAIHSFSCGGGDLDPELGIQGPVTVDPDGNVYGVTRCGGDYGHGFAYRLTPNGASYDFAQIASPPGYDCLGGPAVDGAGNLYGLCLGYSPGYVYKITRTGPATYSVASIFDFAFDDPDPVFGDNFQASSPTTQVHADPDGTVWATGNYYRESWGTVQKTLFKLVPDGVDGYFNAYGGYTPYVVYLFANDTGGIAVGRPGRDADGSFYGRTATDTPGPGTVFKVSPTGVYTRLYTFDGTEPTPVDHPRPDAESDLWITTPTGGLPSDGTNSRKGTAVELSQSGGTWTVRHDFGAAAQPVSVPVERGGRFYYTTGEHDMTSGWVTGAKGGGVFEAAHTGSRWESTPIRWLGTDHAWGSHGGLALDSGGNLFGTTVSGTVFRLTETGSGWDYATLATLPAADVRTRPLPGAGGEIYGTGPKSVWKLTPNGASWDYSTIYSTPSAFDLIYTGLLEDGGKLYGATTSETGGADTVFELAWDGSAWGHTTIATLSGFPWMGRLARGPSGNLYGTTGQGGAAALGTVFELAPTGPTWAFSTIHEFDSTGAVPWGELVFDASGNLFGTTMEINEPPYGTVYRLSPGAGGWTHTVLHSFSRVDGENPQGGLVMGSDGNLYGVTMYGGVLGGGTFYRVVLPHPELSVGSPAAVVEGSGGTTVASFPVTLSFPPNAAATTVDWATADDSAMAGWDYAAATGTVTFVFGETSKTIEVSVIGDTVRENDETFSIHLSSPTNATIAQADGTATITDDDAAQLPGLWVGDVSVNEASNAAVFPVTLSATSGVPVSVDYATADGSAEAGSDYTATTGTLDFAVGQTSRTVSVTIANDGVAEPTETFTVSLSAETSATVIRRQATGTILDSGVVPPPGGPRFDLDGDGKADVLWRSTTGEDAAWLMNGTAIVSGAMLATVPAPWTVAGGGDLDGDGKADVVWHDPTTGQSAVWLMNGVSVASGAMLAAVSPEWTIGDVADLDGDGKADLLWTNGTTGDRAVWFMDGLSTASAALLPTVSAEWAVKAADLDGDGKADLVWRHAASGANAAWLMDGATVVGGDYLPTLAGWTAAAPGDLDGDGKADLVWRNEVSGETAAWLMNGVSVVDGGYLPTVGTPWALAGADDFDGDGKADLLWRNGVSGENAVWLMGGLSVTGGGYAPTLADPAWTVALP